jgi:hypothetical protein
VNFQFIYINIPTALQKIIDRWWLLSWKLLNQRNPDVKLKGTLRSFYGCYGPFVVVNYLCNQCLLPLMLWVRISTRTKCTTLYDKVCQWLGTIISTGSFTVYRRVLMLQIRWYVRYQKEKTIMCLFACVRATMSNKYFFENDSVLCMCKKSSVEFRN